MGAFRDNDRNWNRDPDNMRSGNAGSDNSAPETDNAGNSKGKDDSGFEYPGISNYNAGHGASGISDEGSGASDNFEYGDDSVAGEYEVRESPVFNYGGGSVPETIGAYYGSETRQDRYARDSFDEGYGYEPVPEVDYSEAVNEQISEEYDPDRTYSEPLYPDTGNMPQEALSAMQKDIPEAEYPGSYGHHESQADEFETLRSEQNNESYKYDTDDDPNVAAYNMPFIDESEERMSSLPAGRGPSRIAGTIVVSAIAIVGIIGIFTFAVLCDRRKANNNSSSGYVVPTTKEEVTTSAEATPTATATPTPVPTATPTPEPTSTPVPTNTPAPKPQTQIYWPVAKKATPTPTPETTGEGGSSTGEGSSTSEGSSTGGEGGSTEGGSTGGEGSGTSEGGSGEGGSTTEGGGSGGSEGGTSEGGSTTGGGESGSEGGSGSGSGSGSGTTPDAGGSGGSNPPADSGSGDQNASNP